MTTPGGRSIRKRVIKVKLETAKGTVATGDTAVLTTEVKTDLTSDFEPSESSGLFLGKTEVGAHGELLGECTFKTELRGNGSSGCDAGLAILLQGCGLKQVGQAYNQHSSYTDRKTITIDAWEDGIHKQLVGAMGNVVIEGETGKKIWCTFTFLGRWITVTDVALPAFAPGLESPMYLADGTFTVGGDALKIGKFSLDLGNNVVASLDVNADAGIAHADIPDYDTVLSIDPEAELVANHDFYGKWLAGTTGAVSLIVDNGTDGFTFAIPKFEYREIKDADREKIATFDITGGCLHDSGDDALTITAAAA